MSKSKSVWISRLVSGGVSSSDVSVSLKPLVVVVLVASPVVVVLVVLGSILGEAALIGLKSGVSGAGASGSGVSLGGASHAIKVILSESLGIVVIELECTSGDILVLVGDLWLWGWGSAT